MKRALVVLLVLAACGGIAACSGSKTTPTATNATPTTSGPSVNRAALLSEIRALSLEGSDIIERVEVNGTVLEIHTGLFDKGSNGPPAVGICTTSLSSSWGEKPINVYAANGHILARTSQIAGNRGLFCKQA